MVEHSGWHRRRIFSLSLGDWLDDEVPIEWFAEMLNVIRLCDRVIWILCTHRPENFPNHFERLEKFIEGQGLAGGLGEPVYFEEDELDELSVFVSGWKTGKSIPKNIILLATVENQDRAGKCIPHLLKMPAVCRGLSLEPLLGPVDLRRWIEFKEPQDGGAAYMEIDWLILGGESGGVARSCDVEWIRSLIAQGMDAGVPVFVKQLGSHVVTRNDDGFDGDDKEWPMDTQTQDVAGMDWQGAPVRVCLRHPKGGDMEEWRESLRIREFPAVP